jgi:glucose-1-phosphate thymidylyltransferase
MVRKAVIVASEPTAVLHLANRALVCHALDALGRAAVQEAVVAVDSSMRREIERALEDSQRFWPRVRCVQHDRAGGLAAALSDLDGFVAAEPFVLHLADSLDRRSLGALLKGPVGKLDSSVLVERAGTDEDVVDLPVRRVTASALPTHGQAAGVWILGPGALDAVRTISPSGRAELDAASLSGALSELGGRIVVCPVDDWWRLRDRPHALLEGSHFALQDLRPQPVSAHVVATQIQGAVNIHPSARLESSVVRGPVVIAAGACIKDAYVGPYTSIGRDVLVEGAEIEYSIISDGACVSHLSARLEASVVGPRARVFRDFRLPKATRMTIGEGAQISLG